ncbi:porphobilinogen synthase [candidate division CSSED10-310 bacterium]|uniref:Delta-aminolevulinic acid dehydratase n=1 Tax=candidate division CSSED10-310 bacterium TaxID=2855610 RepID=A0ABV6YVK1_UNCC1
MIRETTLGVDDLIYPLFVSGQENCNSEIKEIPGCSLLSGKYLIAEAQQICDLGIPAVLLFGIPEEVEKDDQASMAYSPVGPIQKAIRALKANVPALTVFADNCLCEFMAHGHCGVVNRHQIDNDLSLELIKKAALSQAEAGADGIAPSGMMDGMVHAIRFILDEHHFQQTLTMPYAAKFAASFYGPFKAGTKSKPEKSRHATHQIDFHNSNESLREIRLDIEEGADIIIVKPALPCLDIIYRVKQECHIPVAAYNVSGEYVMILAAAEKKVMEGEKVMLESLSSIKRAGADLIITYFAKTVAVLLRQ